MVHRFDTIQKVNFYSNNNYNFWFTSIEVLKSTFQGVLTLLHNSVCINYVVQVTLQLVLYLLLKTVSDNNLFNITSTLHRKIFRLSHCSVTFKMPPFCRSQSRKRRIKLNINFPEN